MAEMYASLEGRKANYGFSSRSSMRKNHFRPQITIAQVIILTLLVIGLISRITSNASYFIIPLVVFGGVYLLYKFPPPALFRRRKNARRSAPARRQKTAKRTYPFRVIEGNKNRSESRNESEDDLPKYH